MSVPISRTAIVLLASGLSRRYGRRDKMLADLGGSPLVTHAADAIGRLDPLTRIAVCPADRPQVGELLTGRYVIAVNKKPKLGLGHSIAVGVGVALQFKPDAIILCMADMPFIEPWLIEDLAARVGGDGADIVHCGNTLRPHPPTAFGPNCFDQLAALHGDDGAKSLMGQGAFTRVGINAPAPLMLDVDTREGLDFARRQYDIRERCETGPEPEPTSPPPAPMPPPLELVARDAPSQRVGGYIR
jgi:molybdenum cofactor cytidylyltransferase